jgi:hypothetical protein
MQAWWHPRFDYPREGEIEYGPVAQTDFGVDKTDGVCDFCQTEVRAARWFPRGE